MINRKVLYGYQIQNGTLEIVPEEAEIIRRIYHRYLDGCPAAPPTRPLRRSCGWTMPSTGGWSSQTRRKR